MRPEDRRPLTPRERAREKRRKQIQRRRLVAGSALLVLIILIIVLAATCGGSDEATTTTTTGEDGTPTSSTTSTTLGAATYIAELSGDQAVPPVDTEATGTLLLSYDPDEDTITFSLGVNSLSDPSVAAIFEGAEGEEGAAVVTLFAGPAKEGSFTGTLAEGTLTADDLTGSLQDATLADLIALINEGMAYVSVGNAEHPVEAIRGVITAE